MVEPRRAHDAIQTTFCAHPGRPFDAEPGSDFCSDHRPSTASPERLALAAEVRRLRDTGLTHREVAETLGLSRSYAAALDTDPDGAKQRERRLKYQRPCPDCGKPMDGANGNGPDAPQRCAACASAARHDDRYWTAETVIASFQRFAEVNGRPPTAVDRMIRIPSVRAKLSPERIAAGDAALDAVNGVLPYPDVVERECGSWNNALRLAGLPPNPTGGAAHRGRRNRPRKAKTAMKTWIVLASSDNAETWAEVGRAAARTGPDAIAQIAGSADLAYVAVPEAVWVVSRVEPVTKFQVVAA